MTSTKNKPPQNEPQLQDINTKVHQTSFSPYPDIHSNYSTNIADRALCTPLAQVYEEVIMLLGQELHNETGNAFLGSNPAPSDNVGPQEIATATLEYITQQFPIFRNSLPDLSEEQSLDRFINLINESLNRGVLTATEQLEEMAHTDSDELNEQVDLYREYCIEGIETFIHSFGFAFFFDATEDEDFTSNLQAADEFIDDELLDKLLT
ncbi:DUF5610 domain-containing protein [Neptuniibacter sp. SY11_33]|uniref:DUF5610 domain-containing protein n=1 Tax=Neptuniibacter sp. SY11_33 TaxID=3398215 RepID=UPI0039F5D3B7